MGWYKNKILKKLFLETTPWNAAWKLKNESIYNVIDNPDGYWLADSLLFENNDNIYLFVEAYDLNEKIGKIGVLKYDGEIFKNFQLILERPYHLSYPYVFKYNDKIYMIPETSENNCIEIYCAMEFPIKWKKVKKLLPGKYVDTIVFPEKNGFAQIYTYDNQNKNQVRGILDLNKLEIKILNIIPDNKNKLRCGGKYIIHDDLICYPVQNNEYFYGQSLDVLDCEKNDYQYSISPEKIKNNKKINYKRLHTYSSSKNFEAIDLSNFRFNLFKIFKKIKGGKK